LRFREAVRKAGGVAMGIAGQRQFGVSRRLETEIREDCMATNSGDINELVALGREGGQFEPYAYYGEEEDALTVYFRGDADYARRLNSRVTVFLSLDSEELVGCQIKSVRHVLKDIGWFDVSIEHGKARLDLLFLPLYGAFPDGDDARHFYRKLGEMARRAGIEVDFGPQKPATCG
jgi:hypothetical protein